MLDIKKLNSMNSDDPYKVGPGAILRDYKNFVDSIGLFYPPDPTSEDSCTIGGNVACNAVRGVELPLWSNPPLHSGSAHCFPTGVILNLRRGDVFSDEGVFRIPKGILEPHPETNPLIRAPSMENTTLVNSQEYRRILCSGSHGSSGSFYRIRRDFRGHRGDHHKASEKETTVFFDDHLSAQSRNYCRVCRDREFIDAFEFTFSNTTPDIDSNNKIPHVHSFNEIDYSSFRLIVPSCMEWFGCSTASLLPDESRKHLMESYGAVFVEQEYDNPEQMIESASQWSKLIDQFNLICGDKSERIRTQVALDSQQSRAFRNLRQSVPEKLNERIHPGFIKMGSDFSVPTDKLEDLLKMYDECLPLGHSYVFGHIGNSHVHANILPGTQVELETAQQIMLEMSKQVFLWVGVSRVNMGSAR